MNVQIKVPASVYDKNAHRRFLYQQKRDAKRAEQERIEREERELEILNIKYRKDFHFSMNEMDQKIVLKEAILGLNERERLVIMRRFFQNQTYQSIGDELGITQERVRQMLCKSLRIMNMRMSRI